jgi:N-acetylglutamate synthase-like GNAT family acetyltransferase
MQYSIRPGTRSDTQAIRSLIHAVHINPMDLDWRHFLIAADDAGTLLGCGQIKVHQDGSRELASIAVREELRGQGIASQIIEALLRREPHRPLFLMCRFTLHALYEKFGFELATNEHLPIYFQRIRRMARIFNSGEPPENQLAIMRLGENG